MKNLVFVILYIWQILQNLVGLVLVKHYKPQRLHILDNGVKVYYTHKITGGVSFGNYCIVNTGHYRKDMNESLKRDTVRHYAIGKTKLSKIFGPLYLIMLCFPFMDVTADTIGDVKR